MKLNNVVAQRPTKTIYRDGDLAIKLFDARYGAADVLNEALNLAIVSESGFYTPRLEEVLKIDGRWAIVTEFIEGDTLAKRIADEPDREREWFERLVEIQMDMHGHAAPRLRHHTDKMHAKISASGLDATARYELHTRLGSLPRHDKLCHGDFTPGNVILAPDGRACVIDWAHATQGNASADAARTYLRFALAGNARQAELYLDLFCRRSDTARQYVEKWFSIVAASQLTKGVPGEREMLTRWANVVEYE